MANVFVWMPKSAGIARCEVAFVVTATTHRNELSNFHVQAIRYNVTVQIVSVLVYHPHLEEYYCNSDEATNEREGYKCGDNFHATKVIISQRKVKGRRAPLVSSPNCQVQVTTEIE